MRDGRGLAWLGGWSLDLRLGAPDAVKYPGLALVGGLGMALATAIGAGSHAVFNSYSARCSRCTRGSGSSRSSTGTRGCRTTTNGSAPSSSPGAGTSARSLTSAPSDGRRNLIAASGQSEPITLAEMTASGFRVARVPPLLGRTLLDDDERPGAPPVVVIGHDVWQKRFGGRAVGPRRPLRLGRVAHTIVGVMPAGFAFPISHSYWVPLRLDAAPRRPDSGPARRVRPAGA